MTNPTIGKPPLYKCQYTRNGKTFETETLCELGYVRYAASQLKDKAKTIVILRDSQGADHPDNAGKFFLHEIVK